jgi:hypothetical protein
MDRSLRISRNEFRSGAKVTVDLPPDTTVEYLCRTIASLSEIFDPPDAEWWVEVKDD